MLDDAVEMVRELPRMPPRRSESNKGTYGRVLVIAGSRGMAGAGLLCASAALRAGAGLVRLALPRELQASLAVANPCVMTAGLPHNDLGQLGREAGGAARSLADANDVIAIGPGLGQSPDVADFVTQLVTQSTKPMVIDADALNNLAADPSTLGRRAGPTVITPHPGEFARLLHTDAATVQARRSELAVGFAAKHGLVVVLKGQGTLVTDGRRMYRNFTGNPGMATAGSGDVLTGMIAALMGQRLDPLSASILGVYLHGLAGDLARDDLGEVSVIATDLIDYLPSALQQYQSRVI